jgi:hypothetical protein
MKIDREKFLAAALMTGALGGCFVEQAPPQQPQQPPAPVAQPVQAPPPAATPTPAPNVGLIRNRPGSPAATPTPQPGLPAGWPAGMPTTIPSTMPTAVPTGLFPTGTTPAPTRE